MSKTLVQNQVEQEQQEGENDLPDVKTYGGIEDDIKTLKEGEDDIEPEEEDNDEESETSEGDDEEDGDEEAEPEDDTDDEEKQEDESEEDEEEDEGNKLVTVQDIKKDFPEFFKKHPEMKGVIFRERQYSEIFSDPKEAQVAAQQAGVYQTMEADLLAGESKKLVAALKKNGDSLTKFIAGLVPALEEIDNETYHKLAVVPIKRVLRAAIKKADKSGNTNLRASAMWIHDFVFNDTEIDAPVEFESKAASQKKTPEQEKYEAKLREVEERDQQSFKRSIDEQYIKGITDTFNEGLDPKEELSDWTKKQMASDLMSRLNSAMTSDRRYMNQMKTLWAQAKAKGFDAESKSRIKNTALARAKQLIPDIRRKLRAEALGKKLRDKKEDDKPKRKVIEGSSARNSGEGKKTFNGVPSKKGPMSDMDIIRG